MERSLLPACHVNIATANTAFKSKAQTVHEQDTRTRFSDPMTLTLTRWPWHMKVTWQF